MVLAAALSAEWDGDYIVNGDGAAYRRVATVVGVVGYQSEPVNIAHRRADDGAGDGVLTVGVVGDAQSWRQCACHAVVFVAEGGVVVFDRYRPYITAGTDCLGGVGGFQYRRVVDIYDDGGIVLTAVFVIHRIYVSHGAGTGRCDTDIRRGGGAGQSVAGRLGSPLIGRVAAAHCSRGTQVGRAAETNSGVGSRIKGNVNLVGATD